MEAVCQECGETNRAGTEFCVFCGAYLAWSAPGTVPDAPSGSGHPTTPLPAVADPPAAQHPPPTGEPTRPSTTEAPVPRAADEPAPHLTRATAVRATPCPVCGQPSRPELFFCARCGEQLVPSPAARRLPAGRGGPPSWWHRVWDTQDRLARRAYRQSLPAVYRWRRLVVGVLVVGLLAAFAVVSRGRPVAWALERVDDARGTVTVVPGLQAGVEPEGATLAPSTPGSLLDRTGQAWTTAWSASTTGASCDLGATGPVTIVLTFPEPRRIRSLEIYAGLSDTLPERALQHRPAALAVDFGQGNCLTVPLEDRYRLTRLPADSSRAVSSARIGVVSTHPPAAGGQDVLSISEISLLARPLR